MGDGSWDKSGSRLILHVNNFNYREVNKLQSILLNKFNLKLKPKKIIINFFY